MATLKEFLNIILGHQITVYTDHKNLTYKTFNTERVMCWRLILEKFGPELKYIKGENNVVAEALYRLEISDNHEILNISEIYGYDDKDMTDSAYPIRYHDIAKAQETDAKLPSPFHIKYNTTPSSRFFTKLCCGCCYFIIRRIENICLMMQ